MQSACRCIVIFFILFYVICLDAALEGNMQSACRRILRAEDPAIQLHSLMYSAMTQTEAGKARTAII